MNILKNLEQLEMNSFRLLIIGFLLCFSLPLFADPPTFADDRDPTQNIYDVDSLVTSTWGSDFRVRRNLNAPFPCKTAVQCPSSVIIENRSGSVNLPVDVNVKTLSVGKAPVIDAKGQWVGSPTGLVGPQGIKGDTGAPGANGLKGETGVAGAQGQKGDKGDSCKISEDGDVQCGESRAVNVIGPQGPSGSFSNCQVRHSITTSIFDQRYMAASPCGVGELLTGGGCNWSNIDLDYSAPTNDGRSYSCVGNQRTVGKASSVTAIAICCSK